jgi:SAM-dependent methyltransferase
MADDDRPEPPDDAPDASDDRPTVGYDSLAAAADDDRDPAGSPWGDSPYQQYYAWPATVDVLPAVGEGDRVLLAGCVRGDHVPYSLDRGADVVGVDPSECALAAARERHGDAATFHRVDLRGGVDRFDDGAFDLVCSHLVLGHLADWRPVLASFRRVLTDDDTLVATTVHPAYLSRRDGVAHYYDRVEMQVQWPTAEIPVYYRPPGEMIAAVADAGLSLERFHEPRPEPEYAEHAPERAAAAEQRPEVLVVRASVR